MKFRKIASFMVGASLLAGIPGSVVGQEYYARERVVNLRPVADPAQNFSWTTGQWSAWSSQCSENATRTRSVSCVNGEGQPVADASCTAARPESSQTQSIMTNCVTYSWTVGNWSNWSSNCSDNATRTRSVSCYGSDDKIAADANCPTPRPASSETQSIDTGCIQYYWDAGNWGNWSSLCSQTATRTRLVQCKHPQGGVVSNSFCKAERPAASETAPQTAQCPQQPASCNTGIIHSVYIPESPVAGTGGVEIIPLGVTQETNRSAWIIRNSSPTNYLFSFTYSGTKVAEGNLPAKTDIYVLSPFGAVSHNTLVKYATGAVLISQSKGASTAAYTACQ